MKYRVMTSDGIFEDFDKEEDAQPIYNQKKEQTRKAKVTVGEPKPSCNIHKCYHDETPPKPCEIIEAFVKE